MALENKKLSSYDDLASANIDTTTKLVVLTGATKVNSNLPVVNFIEDTLTSASVVKPLSAKQGKALQDTKAPIANPTFTGAVNGITKSMVGLGNVDNTSDANKPISNLTQSALSQKADSSALLGYAEKTNVNGGQNNYASIHNAVLTGSTNMQELAVGIGTNRSGTITSITAGVVYGAGTSFTKEFYVGAKIIFPSVSGGVPQTIISIIDDSTLTIGDTSASILPGSSYSGRSSIAIKAGIVLLEFADNAAAIAGGLTNGDLYRTADVLKVVHD